MDASSSACSSTMEQSKPPGFFRLLARNAGQNKQGLAVVMLATSCLFLSLSMLDSKRRLQSLQDHYLSLKSENDQLRVTLHSVSDIVFKDDQASPPNLDSPMATQRGKRNFIS